MQERFSHALVDHVIEPAVQVARQGSPNNCYSLHAGSLARDAFLRGVPVVTVLAAVKVAAVNICEPLAPAIKGLHFVRSSNHLAMQQLI
jgi:hypothetical protein